MGSYQTSNGILTFSSAKTDVTGCPGGSDGTITLSSPSGGAAPYMYSIGGPYAASGSFTNLTAGSYSAMIQDMNGCISVAETITIADGVDTTAPTLLTSACFIDSADAAAYNGGWTSGSNGSAGFGPWDIALGVPGDPSKNGTFVGSSVNNNNPPGFAPGDIDYFNRSLAMYGSGGGSVQATRNFLMPLIGGASFSMDLDNGWVEPGGSIGMQLINAAGEILGEFRFEGGDSDYEYANDAGVTQLFGHSFTTRRC
jgi:hypothetical protein